MRMLGRMNKPRCPYCARTRRYASDKRRAKRQEQRELRRLKDTRD